MKISRKPSATSQILQVFIQDTSSGTGAGLTGLTNATSGLTAYYHKDTDTTATAIALVSMTVGTFTSSGFKEIDATNMPGWYQFCPPNAAFTSAASVGFHLKGATNMAPLPIEVDLGSQVDLVTILGTAVSTPATAGILDVNVKNINNVAAATAGASGGILISGSNAGTTTLGALTVTGATTLTGNVSAAAGVTITNSTSNGAGLSVTGNGTGEGILVTGGSGASGDGMKIAAASTNGYGLRLLGNGANAGAYFKGGATGEGAFFDSGASCTTGAIKVNARNTASGIQIIGGATSGDGVNITTTSGHGISSSGAGTTKHGALFTGGATTSAGVAMTGGATSGDGLLISAPTLGHGISSTAAGTSKHGATLVAGGTTAVGLNIVGGSTSGDGVKVVTTSGHGVNLAPVGTSMHGILSTGGNGGTSDGIKAAAGTGGVDIRGNITGNLVGTVSTLTTYTGDTPQTGDSFARIGVAGVGLTNITVGAVAAAATNIKKNTALAGFTFVMTDSTTHLPATGLTITATRSLDGAAFGACTNAAAELSNGVYKIDLAAGDLNGNNVMLKFTATGADARMIGIITQP